MSECNRYKTADNKHDFWFNQDLWGSNKANHPLIITELGYEVDNDGNGNCEFDEFLLLMSKKINEGQMDEEMMEAFKTFDDKNKGYIDINDLQRVLKIYNENLSAEDVQQMFNETDADGDGKINFKDFILMMMAK